ncbi:hypothetical protein [Pseudonocardia sp. HH130629-09]|uniref:hypothetical protein n=1 Tax=Pseudonocardia sp. HH130629-09 TaxID=1641402 RepID=UPI0006CB6CDD|nr:hypothetical protein [Pseudonocardia sp. HH130629-09]ALE85672.1 hypothetical protein XF36_23075 [Pseudonocardia sp. HH130629-09]
MTTYDATAPAKLHRLTMTMCLALIGVLAPRRPTWTALESRGLVEPADDGGYRLTATGQDVADELHNLTAEPEDQTPNITTDDGPTFPECEDAGAHVESEAATHRAAAEVVDAPSTPDHDAQDCGWPPLWPNGAPAPREEAEPDPLNVVKADEIRSGDVVLHGGERHRVDHVSRSGGDVVLSTMRVLEPLPVDGVAIRSRTAVVTLTMSAGTRLRASQPEQLSLTA